jgi:tetratricopeptide (TPR) repeat protein
MHPSRCTTGKMLALFLAPAMLATTATLAVPATLGAQDHAHHGAPELLGSVEFPASCAAEAQPSMNRAVAMLHSFWFEQAPAAFEAALAADPDCAVAHWGVAMTMMGNPFAAPPPPALLEAGAAAAERAAALAARATDRERGLIEAVQAFYRDRDRLDHRTRSRAHEAALHELHQRFPEDPEVAIFYARAVIGNAPPDDLQFERQRYAASLLEPLFHEQPDHPGLAHYLIHAYDAPPLAEHGLEAARRYADIAPSAPHALHMPSHIFTRLGYWDESIEVNTRSAAAEPDPDAAVHPMDYKVYAYLQQGRDDAALSVVRRAVQLPDRFYGGLLGYNFTAMPARYALERSRWDEAAELPLPTGALPYVEAIARFARAVGAARSGAPERAAEEAAALEALADQLRDAGDAYWSTVVRAQHLAAAAWVAHARGEAADAVRLAREAAELEESVEKHPVTPGPLLPARELEADLLLELEEPAQALRSYRRTLEREPNRARTLFGAARAAERAGDLPTARDYYRDLAELMSRADPDRREARIAREFLSAQARR